MRVVLAVLLSLPLLAAELPPPKPLAAGVKVGSYYFPGHFHAGRWSPMAAYGGPTPLLGHYRDGATGVSDWHIRWAVEHGISYFVFDWYCSYRSGPSVQHNTALDEGFLKADYRNLMEFALMWCNEESGDSSLYTSEEMLQTARHLGRYFREPNYLRIGGRPVVVVSRPSRLVQSFGAEFRELIPRLSREAGLPEGTEIFFVALASAPDPKLAEMGFAATTAYNYAWHRANPNGSDRRATYDDMVEGYEQIWRRMTAPGNLPYIVPVSPGWDSRPWYGTKAFVRTGSTPAKFRDMCQRAKGYVDPGLNMVLAECWNEFGEGSYLEPCAETGFGYLHALREAFAPDAGACPGDAMPSEDEKATFTFRTIPPDSAQVRLGKQEGNLVPDSGMEEGTAWATYSGAPCRFAEDDARSGRKALVVEAGQGCKTQNPVPVGRGRTYRVSAWAKCAPGGNLRVQVTYFDAGGRWLKTYEPVGVCRATDWTEVAGDIVVTDPAARAMSLEFVAGDAVARVDDASIVNTREPKPPAVQLRAEGGAAADWVTFAGGTPRGETSPDGIAYLLLADREGVKTRGKVPVKPGEVLNFRIHLRCDELASVSIRSAGFDGAGVWIDGVYLAGEVHSWQDWIELAGVIRVPADTPAQAVNLECVATGGSVRIRSAVIERETGL
ncbi:MAG: glycoside hydrolase family 99-like domain-containing protein [Lentisphaeria bacterium]|jgi:hypothetical protein|nr:glycoside hydrolase family 99-like domain-containing protein [Lentisphaeria bacterium]